MAPSQLPTKPDELAPWAATLLDILRAVGARVTPAETAAPGRPLYRVELPEPVACRRWGTPYRPHPPLLLRFRDRQETGAAAESGDPAAPLEEPVTPFSRRAADIVELALDPGWIGVFHEPPRPAQGWSSAGVPARGSTGAGLPTRGSTGASLPALWVLLEAVMDGGPLARVPPPCWLVAWVDLARPANPAWCGRLVPSAYARGPGADGLSVHPGPPPACPGPSAARRTLRLPAAWQAIMEQAVRSLAQDASVRRWQAALAGAGHDAVLQRAPGREGLSLPRQDGRLRREDPRLQLFVTMAAVVYLNPARPWPPPALPWPRSSSG